MKNNVHNCMEKNNLYRALNDKMAVAVVVVPDFQKMT